MSIFAMLLVFEIITRVSDRQKIKSGQVEDMRKNSTFFKRYNPVQQSKGRIWAEGILIILAGAALIVWIVIMYRYDAHGAFYDQSWRDPKVDSHMLFSARDTKALESRYCKDPENFDFESRKVLLIRMGCEDCEKVAAAINEFDEMDGEGYSVIFSRSDIGRAYVARYNVNFVPSIIYNGTCIQLRPKAAGDDGPITEEDMAAAQSGQDIGGLVEELEKYMEENQDQPGTKTEAEEKWEEQNQTGSASSGTSASSSAS